MSDILVFETDLLKLIKLIWKRLPIILLAAAVAGAAAFFLFRTPVETYYTSDISFLAKINYIISAETDETIEAGESQENAPTVAGKTSIDTYRFVAASPVLTKSLISRAGLPFTVSQLEEMVSIEIESDVLSIISVRVRSSERSYTERIAQAYADYLPEEVARLGSCAPLQILDYGTVTERQSGGPSMRKVVFAALAAAFLVVSVYAIKYSDDEAKGKFVVGADVLAEICPEPKPLSLFRSEEDKEEMERLRTNIRLGLPPNEVCSVIGLTAAHDDPVKEAFAVRIADSFAALGERVLLIDADLRIPRLHELTGSKSAPGLCEILRDQAKSAEAIQHFQTENGSIAFLAAGDCAHKGSELLDERKILPLLQTLREDYDIILLNLEPIGPSVDAAQIGKFIDGVIVFFREMYCTRRQLTECISQLNFANAHILGFAAKSAAKKARKYI